MNEGICTNDKDKNDTNVDFRNAVTPTPCLAATATPSTTLRRTTSRLIKATTTPTDPSSSKPDAPSTDTKIVTTRWSILGICQFFQLNIWFYNLNLFLTFVFSIQLTQKTIVPSIFLPITGFESRTSGVGCDRYTN